MNNKILDITSNMEAFLSSVKVGDDLIRNMGGIEMTVKVTKITDDKIYCSFWKFDKKTGAEIDKDLGWGPHITGAYILPPKKLNFK